LKNNQKNEKMIIVSLTSFPARINRVWLVIETIFRQTKKPEKIILWISKEQFPSLNFLPKRLLKQIDRGLDIRIVDNDIRSYKKYYYTLKEYPNDYLITIDDDIFYRSTMIEDLFNYSLLFPSNIIAQYSCQILWDNEKLTPYITWPLMKNKTINSSQLFFGSGGGTLFPPKSMNSDVLKKELFLELTPTADDVWLNAMCRLNKTKITKTSYYSYKLPVLNWNDITLYSTYNGIGQNDIQINAVKYYYKTKYNIDLFQSEL
jgi:hypothetical protein